VDIWQKWQIFSLLAESMKFGVWGFRHADSEFEWNQLIRRRLSAEI